MLGATAAAQSPDPALRGHGGPIRSIAVLDDKTVATGSFDSTIIVWDIPSGTARHVLRLHDSAVNALVGASPHCLLSGDEDGRIGSWCKDQAAESQQLASPPRASTWQAHTGPIAALAVLPRGKNPNMKWVFSASWDRGIKQWRREAALETQNGPPIAEHKGPVNGIAAIDDGIVSASYDGEVRVTGRDGDLVRRVQLAAAINGLAVLTDSRIALTAGDGWVRVLNPDLTLSFEIELPEGPLTTIAVSPAGGMVAVAGMRTPVALIDVEKRVVARRIQGPGLPIWALAFSLDGTELFTGGADRALRRWMVATGKPVSEPIAKPADTLGPVSNEPGARVFRACAVCHTIQPGDGHRAGPTLHGIMGRRIATAPGYYYSDALKKLDIVWTLETISKLFEVGPTVYTPGTKMPEQRLTDPGERQVLVEWLAKVTK